MLQTVDTPRRGLDVAGFLPDVLHGCLTIEGQFSLPLIGRVRSFTGHIIGTWRDGGLVLDETFHYDNGKQESRVWKLSFHRDGSFQSSCDDVVGVGTGRYDGQSYVHHYVFRQPVNGRGLLVNVVEVYRQSGDTRIDYAATLTKWGMPAGKIDMTLSRL